MAYKSKNVNPNSQPAILNKLDQYGQTVEWHPEPGEEKRTLLSKLINEYVQDKEAINYLQCGSYSGYTTLLVSRFVSVSFTE